MNRTWGGSLGWVVIFGRWRGGPWFRCQNTSFTIVVMLWDRGGVGLGGIGDWIDTPTAIPICHVW